MCERKNSLPRQDSIRTKRKGPFREDSPCSGTHVKGWAVWKRDKGEQECIASSGQCTGHADAPGSQRSLPWLLEGVIEAQWWQLAKHLWPASDLDFL